MGLALLTIIVGFGLLMWSAEKFVTGASHTASYLGMSPLLIGILIVGFGTSLPEMFVSAQAAFDQKPDLAIGNAIGSNIINTALVLGLTALIAPIAVHSKIIKKEIPMLLGIGLLFGWMIWDLQFSKIEASVLLIGFFSLIAWGVLSAKRNQHDHLETEVDESVSEQTVPLAKALSLLIAGLVIMVVSSNLLVWGAVKVAEFMGISNLVIGLTVVAFGTSLPELAASLVAAKKGQHDIAIGNVVGSNMFNLLAVTGLAGFISPIEVLNSEVLTRDWPVMIALTIALWLMAFGYGKEGQISRLDGFLLTGAFVAYTSYLIWSLG